MDMFAVLFAFLVVVLMIGYAAMVFIR